jgi:hypothetical protein
MTGQTVRLVGPSQRHFAKQMIDSAPLGAVVNIREATRTLDQNALVISLHSDMVTAWKKQPSLIANVKSHARFAGKYFSATNGAHGITGAV